MTQEKIPTTQREGCQMAARLAAKRGLKPEFDLHPFASAKGLAAGLFGPAFKTAQQHKRSLWIVMCWAALVDAYSKDSA